MYVLDTNTLIYYFKGMGDVAQHLFSHSPQELAVPAIVVFELEVGIAKSNSPQKRMGQLHEILSVVHVLPFREKEAKAAAEIRVLLEKKGMPIGAYDLLIAGTAMAHQATLVTRNISEFGRVEQLCIENWF